MKALTIGGAMIDTIAIIESDRIERMSMQNADSSFLLLAEGQKIEAVEISAHCGGGGVNAAVCMARLGLDVAALVKLGQDSRAETILVRLLTEGVSTRWALRDARAPTGASVLVSSHDRNAAVFTFRGANTLLEPGDLRDDAFAADIVYVANLSNKSADCFPDIVARGKAAGALVAANPGVRQLSARGMAFQETLSKIDIVSINRTEASVLVPSLVARFGEQRRWPSWPAEKDLPKRASLVLSGGGYEMTLAAFIAAMRELGSRYIVVTDGRNGAYAGEGEEIVYCPALEVEAAGTAGAGDAFTATLAALIALGRPLDEALRAATINSAAVVGHVDTQTGLLARDALEKETARSDLAVRRWRLS